MIKFLPAVSRDEVSKECPWAVVVVKCCGGYMVFDNVIDYIEWRKQK